MATTTTTDFNNLAFINDTDNVEDSLEYMSHLLQNKKYLSNFTVKINLSKDISPIEYKKLLSDFFWDKPRTWKDWEDFFSNKECPKNKCLCPTVERSFLLDHPTDKDVVLLVIPPCLKYKHNCTHTERERINRLINEYQKLVWDEIYSDVVDKHYKSISVFQQLRHLNRNKELEKKISDGSVVKVSLTPTLESAFRKNIDSLIRLENTTRSFLEKAWYFDLYIKIKHYGFEKFLGFIPGIKDELSRDIELSEIIDRSAEKELSKSSKHLSQALKTFKK